ncbi:MAG TPA: sensor histidine kinase [Alphaproteobacteria bacterium]|nr:sensor histidine kinase [Alphaproteobacteria bacterium]
MLTNWIIVAAAFGYLSLLFAVAYWGDKRADAGRSVIASPYVYALSIAVYCTAWTFYGSVGRAASGGIDFLPIYIGPTLVAILWWHVIRKILRISRSNRITSIADFVASRYGKSHLLGGLVTVIAVIVLMPYIALQLKGVSTSFQVIAGYPDIVMPAQAVGVAIWQDTALHVAILMAVFAILFGTRHIDATERHEGMVAAIAFESIVKLVAFLAVGVFVTFFVFDGFGDIFARAAARPDLAKLWTEVGTGGYGGWVTLTLLSMAAILFLPRQFQVSVVENVDERHLDKAVWLFPAYLFAINIFVLPIAIAGLLYFPAGTVDSDTFVLALPMAERAGWLALFAFVGGLSAATGMVIVETIALSTMVSNDLVMPILLRMQWLRLTERTDLTGLLIAIRRASIVLVLFLGYLYFHLIGGSYALVSIGLLSFAAVAQFAPAIIGGIYWRAGNRAGALTGLTSGFVVWVYTLLLPSFARSGWMPMSFLEDGLWGIELLRPYALFGLTGFDPLAHALFWSMVVNIGGYVAVSLATRQGATERIQATRFVEVFQQPDAGDRMRLWRGTASVGDLHELVVRFVGRARADQAFADYARSRGLRLDHKGLADAGLVHFTERLLAGAIGAASARVMVASAVKGADVSIDEVMSILDEASQVIEYSRQLEAKSHELERASADLRAMNLRLTELDRLKDEFITTVTHELRTPLTSIRSFSEILHDNPELPTGQRREFLGIVIKESERLTRLINQVLDLAKLEAGRFDWQIAAVDMKGVVREAIATTSQLFKDRAVTLDARLPDGLPAARADRDQIMQVTLNLLSNAVKFSPQGAGRVVVELARSDGGIQVSVGDNGPGIAPGSHGMIFEKFRQVGDTLTAKPSGTGLGLAICRRIVEHLGGRIWFESELGRGATFRFVIPLAEPQPAMATAAK